MCEQAGAVSVKLWVWFGSRLAVDRCTREDWNCSCPGSVLLCWLKALVSFEVTVSRFLYITGWSDS